MKQLIIRKGTDDAGMLLLGIFQLDKRHIDVLIINAFVFTRRSFELKNGRFNYAKAVDVLPWAFHADIMYELASIFKNERYGLE